MKNLMNGNSVADRFNKTHLAVTVLDKTTGKSISKMPLYAEVMVQYIQLPYRIQLLRDKWLDRLEELWAGSAGKVNDVVNTSVAKYIPVAELLNTQPDDGEKRNLTSKAESLVDHLMDLLTNPELIRQETAAPGIITDKIQDVLLDFLKSHQISNELSDNSAIQKFAYPLGFLATDHVGYASFNINTVLQTIKTQIVADELTIDYLLYPLGLDANKVALSKLSVKNRLTQEVVYAKLEIEKPDYEYDATSLNLPSMQNPSLVDWYMSAGSFASQPSSLLGEDDCERLLPADISLHQFNFYQVVRARKSDNDKYFDQVHIDADSRRGFHLGYIDQYRTSWYSLGHSLGQILYSLPLAPGETVKLAVIDWSWQGDTKRDENTGITEELLHQTHRDRTISETVNAAVSEWQRGGSVMGGLSSLSGSAGVAPTPAGLASFANGLGINLGGGYATSSGNRDLRAENVQKLNDSFAQASSAQRELNSTVVIQARQEEKESIQTRTFSNYNHSHTLTILYYEVFRHFRVVTEWISRKPALLIKYDVFGRIRIDGALTPVPFFNDDNILKYRQVLEKYLLDQKLTTGLDAVQKVSDLKYEFDRELAKSKLLPDLNSLNEVGEIMFVIKTGNSATNAYPSISILTKSGLEIRCIVVSPKWGRGNDLNGSPMLPDFVNTSNNPNYRQSNQECVFIVKPEIYVSWGDAREFIIKVSKQNGVNTTSYSLPVRPWDIASITAVTSNEKERWIMLSNSNLHTIQPDSKIAFSIEPYRDIPKDPADLITREERIATVNLKKHINDNIYYYQRLIWLSEDSNARAVRFSNISFGSEALIDIIDNRPVDILGDFVAFPFAEGPDISISSVKSEKLITLPTRGVFAEGKLGHCNISEVIDNTRFWKWEEHPIPFPAPDISPVTPVTPVPQTITVEPSTVPTTINIQQPSAAPDPQGLTAALTAIVQGNIFRDMSMQTQVNELLRNLNDNTAKVALASAEMLKSSDGSAAAGKSVGERVSSGTKETGRVAGNAASGQATGSSAESQKESEQIDNERKKAELAKEHLSPREQAKVRAQIAEKLTERSRNILLMFFNHDGSTLYQNFEEDGDVFIRSNDGSKRFPFKLFNDGGQCSYNEKFPQTGTIEVKFHIKIKNHSERIEGLPFKEYADVWCMQIFNYKFKNNQNDIVISVKLKVEKRTIVKTTQYTEGNSNSKSWSWDVKANLADKVPTKIGEVTAGAIGGGGKSGMETQTNGHTTTITETYELIRMLGGLDMRLED